jgi:DNA-directed RNA polymerase specialized sigma24 family protein
MGEAMPSAGSISALVQRLEAGDHDAAQPLWEHYYPRLVALARKHLRGTSRRVADEEDVALSAFDSFCRGAEQGRFPRLADRDGLWALLVLITVRKAANHAAREACLKRGAGRVRGDSALARPDGGGFDDVAASDPAPDVAVLLAEGLEALLRRLGDGPLRAVAVWRLEGYDNAEIASRLGQSEVTVRRRLRLIRKILEQV